MAAARTEWLQGEACLGTHGLAIACACRPEYLYECLLYRFPGSLLRMMPPPLRLVPFRPLTMWLFQPLTICHTSWELCS